MKNVGEMKKTENVEDIEDIKDIKNIKDSENTEKAGKDDVSSGKMPSNEMSSDSIPSDGIPSDSIPSDGISSKKGGCRVSLTKAAKLIAGVSGKSLILCHKRPDGDTLGSALALRSSLEYLGKTADIACCDKLPSNCTFLFCKKTLPLDMPDPSLYEAVIAVDVASVQMLGELSYLSDKVLVKLDHHRVGEDYAEYNYVDPEAAACGEIIYQLAKLMGVPDKVIAEPIYAALSSDSGGFRYSNTTRRTMQIASSAMAAGADFVRINHELFESRTPSEIRAIKTAYEKLKLYHGGRLAIVMITNDDKKRNELDDAELGVISSLPREIAGVALGVTVRQDTKDPLRYKVSMRSSEAVDVSTICAGLGGGGHLRAAGCEIFAPDPEKAVEKLLLALSECEKSL